MGQADLKKAGEMFRNRESADLWLIVRIPSARGGEKSKCEQI